MSTPTKLIIDSTLNAYAQIFFTKNRVTAILILLATFTNPKLGLWGLLSVWLSNGLAYIFGFNRHTLQEGLYALNGLLVGLGLALIYSVNEQFLLIFFTVILLTLLISVAVLNYLARLGLPFLVIPFLLSFWLMLLAVRQYSGLVLSEGSIFLMNKIYGLGGMEAVQLYEKIMAIEVVEIAAVYFKSLAAILFQEYIVTGVLIAVGILISSRIAFTLSVLGFLVGYGFYYFIGADMTQLHYSHIGFNFILTAIGIGGFFFIPTWKTYSLVVITTPIIAILIAAFSSLLAPFLLPIYSLPFVVVILMVLYVANFNVQKGHLQKVQTQTFSPEKNLYAFQNWQKRFAEKQYFRITLPFYGEWHVSQGHDGEITHKSEWQHAWDFDIIDEEAKTYQNFGTERKDFYSYGLPVTAPANGYVTHIINHVEDNEIGEVNLQDNWGNVIVIKHAEYLYSKLGHLQKDSFKVKIGDYIQKGQVIANLGNSGRSPEPHIHFQLQATPYVGSRTLKYPLAYYLLKENNHWIFKDFDISKQGDIIQNVVTKPLMTKAFFFELGQILTFKVLKNGNEDDFEIIKWEVGVNAANQTYLYCTKTKSYAHFVNDGTVFYFTSFEGNTKSLLFYFYLAAYKVLLGFYKNLEIEDNIPIDKVKRGIRRWLQDFIAPFKIYNFIKYKLHYTEIDNDFNPKKIGLHSTVISERFGFSTTLFDFVFEIEEDRIMRFVVEGKRKKIVVIGD